MFTWTTLSIIFKVHSRSGRYLTLPRVTAPDSLQTQAEFHLHTSQHFKAFLQSFRTENARVAATKTPHGSEAIFGSKFIAGRDLLSWSVLLHAAFSGAAGPRALMGEGNSLSPRQCLKGGAVWRVRGAGVGPWPTVRSCSQHKHGAWHSPRGSEQLPARDSVSWASPEAFALPPLLRLCAPAQQHRRRKQPTTLSWLPALAQPTASSLSWGRRNNSSKWNAEGNKTCAF